MGVFTVPQFAKADYLESRYTKNIRHESGLHYSLLLAVEHACSASSGPAAYLPTSCRYLES
jgi:hypothetical protein